MIPPGPEVAPTEDEDEDDKDEATTAAEAIEEGVKVGLGVSILVLS